MFKNILHYQPYIGEVNQQPSLTVPDQTMSMRQILARHSRGLPISNGKEPIYHGEDDYIPDPRTLDLVDRQEYAEKLQETVKTYKQQAAEKAAEKAALKAAKQGNEVTAVE